MKTDYQKFISDVAAVGITEFIIRASGLVTLPILTRMLLPSSYGLWALILITITIVSSVFQAGLGVALVRFVPSEKNGEDQAKTISDILGLVFVLSLIGMAFFWLVAPALGKGFLKISAEDLGVFRLSVLFIPLYALREMLMRSLRALRWMGRFAGLNCFKVGLEIGGLLWLFHTAKGTVPNVVCLYLMIEAVTIGAGFWFMAGRMPLRRPDLTRARSYLPFALPLAANALLLLAIHSSDRYLLSHFIGFSAAGIYTAALNISMIAHLFLMPIQSVLLIATADLYDANQLDEVRTYFRYSIKYYLILTMPLVLGLVLYGRPFIRLVATAAYLGDAQVLPWLTVGCLFYGVYQLLIFTAYLRKRTQWDFILLLGGAATNIILNILLIPPFGPAGAAAATAVSFLLLALAAYALSCRYLGFLFHPMLGLRVLAASSAMGFLIVLLSERKTIWDPVPIGMGLLVYFGALSVLRTFRMPELRLLVGVPSDRL
ncbi:MAG: oligosaccharide flippase family protein [Candidatus Omnitrophota bacterium]